MTDLLGSRNTECMRLRFYSILLSFAVIGSGSFLPSAWAQGRSMASMGANSSSQEFIMACTYGVLAGTLIGAASLAFVDKPSDNLNKVARGASLGLYAGILLGAYVIYVVPDDGEEDNPLISKNFLILPTWSEKGIDGAMAQMNLFNF